MTVIYSPEWRKMQDERNKEEDKELHKFLGADFRTARAETGLSQKALAELTEVPLHTIRHWEQGQKVPPAYVKKWYLQEVNKIAKKKAARK